MNSDRVAAAASARSASWPWAAAVLVLMLLATGPIWQGVHILQQPARLRSQTFSRVTPTTGPYTPAELDNAAMDWRQLSGVMRHDIPPDELAPLAESRRRQEDIVEAAWQRRHKSAVAQADVRRPYGWLLIGLGIALMLVFAWLGLRIVRTAGSQNEAVEPARHGDGPAGEE